MSAKSQTLAKSLHTVSVLVNVARLIQRNALPERLCERYAVDQALIELGYANGADPYGLAAKAVAILSKGAQS